MKQEAAYTGETRTSSAHRLAAEARTPRPTGGRVSHDQQHTGLSEARSAAHPRAVLVVAPRVSSPGAAPPYPPAQRRSPAPATLPVPLPRPVPIPPEPPWHVLLRSYARTTLAALDVDEQKAHGPVGRLGIMMCYSIGSVERWVRSAARRAARANASGSSSVTYSLIETPSLDYS